MPTYTATATDALAVHAVGVDLISHKILELILAPRGHHVLHDLSLQHYLQSREAFRCELLILAGGALQEAETALVELYRDTHREIPRAALLMPGEPDVPLNAASGWDFALRAPLGAEQVLRTVNALLKRRHMRQAGEAPQAAPAIQGALAQGQQPRPTLEGMHGLFAETGLDEAAARDLQRSFIARGEEYLSTMQAELDQGDLAALLVTCHAMKGMTGNMRFAQLRQTCESLEAAGKHGTLEEARAHCAALRDQFLAIVARLQAG
ncbi:MAG: Hpt domain-containing protein [Candidatus Lambdaproteobacteria bacterium]|nr:Hpt domain-containing protein [Candidatus Lambdaproteobacteria bacterium]